MTAIVEFDPLGAEAIKGALGPESSVLPSLDALKSHLELNMFEDCVVLGPSIDQVDVFALAEDLRVSRPSIGVVMVRRRIDTAVLSDAIRAGVREVVQERDLAGLAVAVRRQREIAARLRVQIEPGEGSIGPGQHGRVITVFSAKGGCGKTTLATNLAAALADSGTGSVALRRPRPRLRRRLPSRCSSSRRTPSPTPCRSATDLDGPALMSLLTTHRSGLKALVAPMEPSAGDSIDVTLVTRILDLLREEFDYVVVDTPPAFDDHVLAAFDRSDLVALIATLDIPALKNLKLTLETLELLSFPRDRLQDRAEPRRLQGRSRALRGREDAQGADRGADPVEPRDVPASINRGVAIVSDDPKQPGEHRDPEVHRRVHRRHRRRRDPGADAHRSARAPVEEVAA